MISKLKEVLVGLFSGGRINDEVLARVRAAAAVDERRQWKAEAAAAMRRRYMRNRPW